MIPARLLVLAFFLSGISGLIYQVLWLRMLGLVFGVTVLAATTVVASFMGGLAIGSAVAGVTAGRVRHPLRWFAACEALVAITALASPLLLAIAQELYVSVHGALPESVAVVTAMRFVLASLVLLIPTTLMGATLPLVVQSSVGKNRDLGGHVSLLYGANTAGAIVGTMAAAFLLIGAMGLTASFRVAAALNVMAACIALAVSYAPRSNW